MPEVLNVKSDGRLEIQTESNIITHADYVLSADLQALIDQVSESLSNMGGSEIHIEKDTWRAFEHVVVAGEVGMNDFGTTVSDADFSQIMTLTDQVVADAAAAAAEAAAQEPSV